MTLHPAPRAATVFLIAALGGSHAFVGVAMSLGVALLLSYLVGSIPTAYWLVKGAKGVDIRTMGSGNVGATNVLRTTGLWAGLVVLVIDVLKGLIAARMIPHWVLGEAAAGRSLVCGLAAVVGHDFSCCLALRGGKGVATTMGVLLGSSQPLVAGLVALVWVGVFVSVRYVSLSSLTAAVAIPISQLALRQSIQEIVIGSVLAGLIIVRHRTNLKRLLSGIEPRAWPRAANREP